MDILNRPITSKKEFVNLFAVTHEDKTALKSEYKEIKKHFSNHVNKVSGNQKFFKIHELCLFC